MKKILATALSLLMAFTVVGASACKEKVASSGKEEAPPAATKQIVRLTNFEDSSVEVNYGSEFDVSSYLTPVQGDDGKSYTPVAAVYDPQSHKVELTDNKFTVSALSYTLKLKIKVSDTQLETKLVTISVVDKSDFAINFMNGNVSDGEIYFPYTVPTAVGARAASGESKAAEVKIYLINEDETRTEQTVENGKFLPTVLGKYVAVASLIDEKNDNKLCVREAEFDVLKEIPRYLEEFTLNASNIKTGVHMGSSSKPIDGVYCESVTDKDGVTEYGVGNAEITKSNGCFAFRFDKTQDELKEILSRVDSITFRMLVRDADNEEGGAQAGKPLELLCFGEAVKKISVNTWTDITLTREELFNDTLKTYFGTDEEGLIEEYVDKNNGFHKDGNGYLRKGSGTVYRGIKCSTGTNSTQVYLDEISYTLQQVVDFRDETVEVKFGDTFSFANYLSATDFNGYSYTPTVKLYDLESTEEIPLEEGVTEFTISSSYQLELSVTLRSEKVVTRRITISATPSEPDPENALVAFSKKSDAKYIIGGNYFGASGTNEGSYLLSYTDSAGVTEQGIGKAQLTSGRVPVRFDKTEAELKELFKNIDTMTFRILIHDADYKDGANMTEVCYLQFFGVQKTIYNNVWTTITLTREELFNATLLGKFATEEQLIDYKTTAGDYCGYAQGLCATGRGYVRNKASMPGATDTKSTIFATLMATEANTKNRTQVYIDDITYTLQEV